MEKLKAGIFDVPQIRELMKDPMFDEAQSKAELFVWQPLKSAVKKLPGKPPECRMREGSWRATEEFLPTWCTKVVRTALRLFFTEQWRAEWALSTRHSHFGRVLPRPVVLKNSRWLLLLFETGCGGCRVQVKVSKTFYPWIVSFVYFSVYCLQCELSPNISALDLAVFV